MNRYTDTEWSTITNGLRVAAEVYDRNEAYLRVESEFPGGPCDRLANQFQLQAKEARALAAKIEDQEAV